jgi:hypothetical protein
VELLNPLLTDEMRAHPAWRCWLKHVELIACALQHKFALTDVKTIDDLVVEHSGLFDQVPNHL